MPDWQRAPDRLARRETRIAFHLRLQDAAAMTRRVDDVQLILQRIPDRRIRSAKCREELGPGWTQL
jgi:hypothetical protein